MTQASLKVYFFNIFAKQEKVNLKLFDQFMLEDNIYNVKEKTLEIDINFNDYDKDRGFKVCRYKLLKNDKNSIFYASGLVEIYSGINIGCCFIDTIGSSFDISFLFLKDEESLSNFLEEKYTLSTRNIKLKESIYFKPNQNNTKDRAHFLLINCPRNLIIKKSNNNEVIDIEKIINEIDNYNPLDSYQICLHKENDKNFVYRKITTTKELNFSDLYNRYQNKIDTIYNNIISILKSADDIFLKDILISDICDKYYDHDFINIFYRKYTYSKNILEKEINQEEYINFIFKCVYFNYICYFKNNKKKDEILDSKYLLDIYNKLLENKDKIIEDTTLKIYEKFFLTMELFFSKVVLEKEYKIIYYNTRNKEDFSPLFFAYNFLNEFVDTLDEKSEFYYPLLSIDSDVYLCNLKTDLKEKLNISTYGFNMLSLNEIKKHMKDLLPEVLVFSYYFNDEKAITNPFTGMICLDGLIIDTIEIDKEDEDEYKSKHVGFLIAKYLFHEYLGHKKSSFSKSDINYRSSISFKDHDGNLLFLNEENDTNLFKEIKEIMDKLSLQKRTGDSGYFLEYYLGKIDDSYTMKKLDMIENQCNLSSLLQPSLWHENLPMLKEYIKLNEEIISKYKGKVTINKELDLKNQIIDIKNQIKEIEDQKNDVKAQTNTTNTNQINVENVITNLNEAPSEQEKLLGSKTKRKYSKEKETFSLKKRSKENFTKDFGLNLNESKNENGQNLFFNKRVKRYPELIKYYET